MNIKEEVSKVLAKRVDVSALKEDDNLSALGLDSLDLVEVMLEIEEAKTLRDVLDLIDKKVK